MARVTLALQTVSQMSLVSGVLRRGASLALRGGVVSLAAGGVRTRGLSHVPVDDVISGLNAEQIQVPLPLINTPSPLITAPTSNLQWSL